MTTTSETKQFTNWAGNLSCTPSEIAHPETEQDVVAIFAAAADRGEKVRIVGTGHSFSPIHLTEGVLICLDRMNGIVSADPQTHRVVAKPGTRIRDFGDELWAAGLCLKNQGDIDAQQIVGAMSTATHGSGAKLGSFSATAKRFRVVLPSGEIIEVDESNPDLMDAMRVSLGLLGVITEVEFEAREAFAIAERIEFWPLQQILDRWDGEMANRRHFSFFWMPYSDSPDELFMDYPEGMDMADHALVKLYDEAPASAIDESGAKPDEYDRVDRPYRIYPDPDFEGTIVMRELEYMVPFERGKDAFLALRQLILDKYPNDKFPIEVRSIKADTGMLSPFYQRDSISISLCGHESKNYREFLADVARTLDPFDPRPHWGKVFYMDHDRLVGIFPRFEDFRRIRSELDPNDVLLSPQLAALIKGTH